MSEIRYPNESSEYRLARKELLQSEIELRQQLELVAEQRRQLPPGGALKEDYEFVELVDGESRKTRFSELFGPGQDTLFLYSFMYAPDMEAACPMCTALLDGLDGQVTHLSQRIGVAVIAKHEIAEIHRHADARGWSRLRLLSSAGTSFNVDYLGEVDGDQRTNANVFVRDGEGIRHFWGAEMSFAGMIEGGNMLPSRSPLATVECARHDAGRARAVVSGAGVWVGRRTTRRHFFFARAFAVFSNRIPLFSISL